MLLLYGVAVFVVLRLNVAASEYAMRSALQELSAPYGALPDVLHKVLPTVSVYAPDAAVALAAASAAAETDEEIANRVLLCFLVRPLFVCSTRLPSPMKKGMYFHTHDLVFSGHTIVFLAAAHVLYATHSPALSVIVGIVGPLLSIASKQHYTLDVLVAFAVWKATAGVN